ncbi:uncharacterized protein LOC132703200 [Cylas formicarius]|uniref:uncharacterized protein LOC132703200 n=1 Tax=Cylas formicarius TaxID=197179 RepID=UPI0029586785|nr:uncharacterized protein LOC132703200 [Cylas formicarius]
MEDIFKRLSWEEKGINIDGKRLNHLRFADDIVLFSSNTNDLTTMIQELKDASQATAEITGRINLTWIAFGKLSYIYRNPTIPVNLKKKVYNMCILSVTTRLETVALTVGSANRLRVCQRAIERTMLGVSLRERIRNEEIRRTTRVCDVVVVVVVEDSLRWRCAGPKKELIPVLFRRGGSSISSHNQLLTKP